MGGDNIKAIAAGLPNIKGSTPFVPCFSYTVSGAFTFIARQAADAGSGSGWSDHGNTDFDASKSNAIYGNSDTVQPPAFALIPQIKY